MWSYYGAKTNIIDLYPAPKHAKIIEPFCGTARYALKYFDKEVLLVDKYDVIIKIWKWLQLCSPKDILDLPRTKAGDDLRDFSFDIEEQKMFMGFVVTYGTFCPGNIVSVSKSHSRGNFINFTLNRIAKNLYKIRHWEIRCGSYDDIPNETGTWFIDPPYQFGGHKYKISNKHLNYDSLRDWCQSRAGQVMVCENTKATWMDFNPMVTHQGCKGKNFEAIWTNQKTQYDNVQGQLF